MKIIILTEITDEIGALIKLIDTIKGMKDGHRIYVAPVSKRDWEIVALEAIEDIRKRD